MTHVTTPFDYETIHPVHGYTFKQWAWGCSCGAKGTEYPNERQARLGARLHRAVVTLPA